MMSESFYRNETFHLTAFSGPNGKPMLQITMAASAELPGFVQLSLKDAAIMAGEILAYVMRRLLENF